MEPKALPAVPNRLPLEAPLEAGAPKENVFDMMRNVCRGVGIIRAALVTVRRDGEKQLWRVLRKNQYERNLLRPEKMRPVKAEFANATTVVIGEAFLNCNRSNSNGKQRGEACSC